MPGEDKIAKVKSALFQIIGGYEGKQSISSQNIALHTRELLNDISSAKDTQDPQAAQETDFINHVSNFEDLIDGGDLYDSSSIVEELQETLDTLERISDTDKLGNLCPRDIFDILEDRTIECKALFKHRLEDIFSMAFAFHCSELRGLSVQAKVLNTPTGRNAPSKRFFSSPVTIASLFDSIPAPLLSNLMTGFADRIKETFLVPILEGNPELQLQKRNTVCSLKFKKEAFLPGIRSKLGSHDPLDCFENLKLLGKFLGDNVFVGEGSGCLKARDSFASIFYPHLLTEVYSKTVYPNLPSDKSQVRAFSESIQSILGSFESEWKNIGLIPEEKTGFSGMANEIPLLYAKKRRETLLSAAREIIMSNDWNTVEVHDSTEQGGISLLLGSGKLNTSGKDVASKNGKEGLETGVSDLKLPRFSISVQAQTIIETAYQVIQEADESDEQTTAELMYLAKDLIDLYRAVFPVYHAQTLSAFPGRAALFWNDTQYFCHHLTTLADVMKRASGNKFPVFETGLDVIPEFRRVGQQWFRFMLRSQRDNLSSCFDKVKGLDGLSSDARMEEAESGLREVLYQYLSLSKTLMSILPTSTYFEVMGTLLDSMLERLFLEIDKVSVSAGQDESSQLCYLMSIFENVGRAFEFKRGKSVEKGPIVKYSKEFERYEGALKHLQEGGRSLKNY
ncbi:MAG: hypothetical protein SGCHY_000314 [Lobulomycetales sp.]